MKYFPIYMKVATKRICLIGNGEAIIAKLRLVAKSDAMIEVYAPKADAPLIELTSKSAHIHLYQRRLHADDLDDMARPQIAFAYLAQDETEVIALCEAASITYCVIDDLAASAFITPAIIDRDPVVIAIGTEGTAPVLARQVKKAFEARLPQTVGTLAQVAGNLRQQVQQALPFAQRRHFWSRFFATAKPHLSHEAATEQAKRLLAEMSEQEKPQTRLPVWFVGAGPGAPELLTMQARRLLDEADVILHDRLVPSAILDLCRREAEFCEVGKTGFGSSWRQDDIHALMVKKAKSGLAVVRLKSGDACLFGRLDEEIAALDAHNIPFEVAPGLTSATVGAAHMASSLTRRGRNSTFQFLTGHDVNGYAEHEWRTMAKKLADGRFAAALYMSVRAAPYLSGRLMMHGAPADTIVTIAENISRPEEAWLVTTLGHLAADRDAAQITGPAIIYLGLASHHSRQALRYHFPQKEAHNVTRQA